MSRSSVTAVGAALLVISTTSGCTRQERSITTGAPADTQTYFEPSPEGGEPALAGGGAPDTGVVPGRSMDTTGAIGGTLAELRQRLIAEAKSLDRAVAGGRLDEVTARALRTRDLVVTLAGKVTALPADKAQEIESLVGAATQATENLRAHAAARELEGLKTRNVELQGIVARIVAASAASR